MKTTIQKCILTLVGALTLEFPAHATSTYLLTIKNGGTMPLSPAVIYVKEGPSRNTHVGQEPSKGFIQLCQTGNPDLRSDELKNDSTVKFVMRTMAPILPGKSQTLEVPVINPSLQSIHFETMYGNTKDICAVGSVDSHSLHSLSHHMASKIVKKDDVLLTGAFLDPVLPGAGACMNANSAVSCLRELSLPNPGKAQIRFFATYFPSVINFLEQKYGATEVQTLLLPSSGAVELHLKLKKEY